MKPHDNFSPSKTPKSDWRHTPCTACQQQLGVPMASQAAAMAKSAFRAIHGVVVTAGLMQKTVKVRIGGQVWNNRVKKYFDRPRTVLVHDPNDSLRAGDVVSIISGWRTSKTKRHVVQNIIAPAVVPIEERPPIPSEQERWTKKLEKRAAKLERRSARSASAELEKNQTS